MIDYRENAKWTVYIHIVPKEISGYDWDKYYVGITSQIPTQRWRNGKGYKNNNYFFKAINKYGWDNIQHEIICSNITEREAKKFEIILISKLKSNEKDNGYNITSGGDGALGRKMSDETKRKMIANRPFTQPSMSKKVYKFSDLKEFIDVYPSIMEAARSVSNAKSNASIRACVNNNQLYAHGFIWRFEKDVYINEDNIIIPINLPKPNAHRNPVYQFNDNLQFINKFTSISEAAVNTNTKIMLINNSIATKTKGNGYYWAYAYNVQLINNVPHLIYESDILDKRSLKNVYQFDANTKKYIKKYNTLTEAATLNNYNINGLCGCVNGRLKVFHNYIWKYKKDVIEKDGSFFIAEN